MNTSSKLTENNLELMLNNFEMNSEVSGTFPSGNEVNEINFFNYEIIPDWLSSNSNTRIATNFSSNNSDNDNSQEIDFITLEDSQFKTLEAASTSNNSERSFSSDYLDFYEEEMTKLIDFENLRIYYEIKECDLNQLIDKYIFDEMNNDIDAWISVGRVTKKKNRKIRQQIKILQTRLHESVYLFKQNISEIAAETRLTETEVYKWFHNNKNKKEYN